MRVKEITEVLAMLDFAKDVISLAAISGFLFALSLVIHAV